MMKTIVSSISKPTLVAFLIPVLFSIGCATSVPNSDQTRQRGWIGGEYREADRPSFPGSRGTIHAFPKSLPDPRKTGILVTTVSTNTPAGLAGLRAGDLILDVNHQPVTGLADFRRQIEQSIAGTSLLVSAWRDNQMVECAIPVGRETYRNSGLLAVGVFWEAPRLVPNPGFSWVALGYEPPGTTRTELRSAEPTYRRLCSDGKYEPVEQDWAVWLGVVRVAKRKAIMTQENPAPPLAPSPLLAP